jgi:DHA2 family multidrug resistance protein-like MFS transporter
LFAINVPIGVVALIIATCALPETERAVRRLNYVGAALHVAAFALLIGGLQALAHDAAKTLAATQLACGALLVWALVRHESARAAPIIPFDLLRVRMLALSLATSVCSFTAQMAGLVALPFEIQHLGHTAVETGLYMTPWPLGVALAAPIAGHLADRYRVGILGAIGLLTMACGLTLLAYFPAGGTAPQFVWRMALCGVGFGLFQSPNNRAILALAPRARSGAAGGMLGTARLLGQATGAAVVAILFRAYPERGSNLALATAAGVALLAALVSTVRLADGRTAERRS